MYFKGVEGHPFHLCPGIGASLSGLAYKRSYFLHKIAILNYFHFMKVFHYAGRLSLAFFNLQAEYGQGQNFFMRAGPENLAHWQPIFKKCSWLEIYETLGIGGPHHYKVPDN